MKGLFLFLSLLINTLNAQETIIVTADRIKSSIENSPADIEVFESADFKNQLTVAELLRQSSDVSVSQSGPIGGNTSLFIRGSDSSHTLVIIDGIVMNDPSNPNRQFDFGRLSLNNIEKIEILKGSQGLLYGSNAIGGVVLITTKQARDNFQLQSSMEIGSHQTINPTLDMQQKWNQTRTSFGIDFLQSAGFSAANDRSTAADKDGFKRGSFNASLEHKMTQTDSISLYYKFFADEAELDKSGGLNGDDPNDYQTSMQHFLKVEGQHLWQNGETKLTISRADQKRTLYVLSDLKSPASSKTDTRGKTEGVGLNHTQFFSDSFTLNSNLEFQNEADGLRNKNQNISLFNYGRIDFGASVFTVGARLDYNKFFKEHLTYKASYMKTMDWFVFKTSLATGFRAPSINQLFDPLYGNRKLNPEKSQTIEAGIEVKKNTLVSFETVLFKTDLYQRLTYDPVTFVNQNRGKSRIQGIENNFTSLFDNGFKFNLSATILSAKDLESNQRLARRPQMNSRSSIGYDFLNQTLGLDGIFVGKRSDVDNAGNLVDMNSHTVFHFRYAYALNKNTSLSLNIKNIFNRHYEETYGYGTGGRMIFGALKYAY